jgi:hypothetical protein
MKSKSNLETSVIVKSPKKDREDISCSQKKILEIMRNRPNATMTAACLSEQGISGPLSGIGQGMKGLVKRGMLKLVARSDGHGKKTEYQLTPFGKEYNG